MSESPRWRITGWCAKCLAQGIVNDDAITVTAADEAEAVQAALAQLVHREPDQVNPASRWTVERVPAPC